MNGVKLCTQKAMRNLPSLKQHLIIDGHVSEEVRIFKYSGPLITEETKLVTKINMTTAVIVIVYCNKYVSLKLLKKLNSGM
jgi:hypothetical protein